METATMGRVTTEATIESLEDLLRVRRGQLAADQVRRIVVKDALVDTGATGLSLPTRMIRQLGLQRRWSKRVTTSAGRGEVSIYDAVQLTIEDWSCTVDVVEVPDEVPVLSGQVPLELLDFVVDPQQRKLIANPAHGGEHMLEMY